TRARARPEGPARPCASLRTSSVPLTTSLNPPRDRPSCAARHVARKRTRTQSAAEFPVSGRAGRVRTSSREEVRESGGSASATRGRAVWLSRAWASRARARLRIGDASAHATQRDRPALSVAQQIDDVVAREDGALRITAQRVAQQFNLEDSRGG